MKYLLDTHTAIWALDDKLKLSDSARSVMEDDVLSLSVSIASAWEIAIKVGIGKLNFNGGSALFLEKMRKYGIEILGIEESYVKCVEALPFLHRDPFDRMIVATAISESLTILTSDINIQKYNVSSLW